MVNKMKFSNRLSLANSFYFIFFVSIGILVGSYFELIHEITTVKFFNKSNRDIKNIEFFYNNYGEFRGVVGNNFLPNQSMIVKWHNEG
jgi:hypothetical protein